jgi:acetolactate synthase-1/2/3 large subunit
MVDFFGYQGTNICFLVDSISRNPESRNHSCYNEQGASFAACGLAQASACCAVVYATSGPGAANILSGVASAYFDSLPMLCLTGQINTYEYDENKSVRQHSFQEIDIASMARPITKHAVMITDAARVRYELEKAYYLAISGRPGPVLVDLPMNIQRAEIDPEMLEGYCASPEMLPEIEDFCQTIRNNLAHSQRPVILVGNGVDIQAFAGIRNFAERMRIPLITSVFGRHLMDYDDPLNFGYLGGAYGFREANLIAARKADLLVAVGISLCSRQIGTQTAKFASGARLIRVDVEPSANQRRIKPDEIAIQLEASTAGRALGAVQGFDFSTWLTTCEIIRSYCRRFDAASIGREPNHIIERLSKAVAPEAIIACDVGQHMMWVAQSFRVVAGQRFLYSGGHGAMGYALPAAIGACYCSHRPVYCFAGDGGFQMNIQELEWVARESLPIKMIVLNNRSLGMVRFQQDGLFAGDYEGTAIGHHYSVCDFVKIAQAYGLRALRIDAAVLGTESDTNLLVMLQDDAPLLVEISLSDKTAAYPKTSFGEPIYNQQPYMPADDLDYLLGL